MEELQKQKKFEILFAIRTSETFYLIFSILCFMIYLLTKKTRSSRVESHLGKSS